MKKKLYKNPKIEIRLSKLVTDQPEYGVFASDDIKKGELLEECHWIPFDPIANKGFSNYNFRWPKDGEKRTVSSAIVLGYGAIFNHSIDNPNANYETDEEN